MQLREDDAPWHDSTPNSRSAAGVRTAPGTELASVACMRFLLVSCSLVSVLGCDNRPTAHTLAAPRAPVTTAVRIESSAQTATRAPHMVEPACESPALHFENGQPQGLLCPEQARARGLTVVDLSDTWTPAVLGEGFLYTPDPAGAVVAGAPAAGAGDTGAEAALASPATAHAAPPGTSGESLAAPAGPAEAGATPALPAAPVLDTPDYHATYVALANERFTQAGAAAAWAADDRYLELYGVFPSLSILRARFADAARHACHDAVDDSALPALAGVIWQEQPAAARARAGQARSLRAALERQRTVRNLESVDDLVGVNAYYAKSVARLKHLETLIAALTATEAHLVCDGLLAPKRLDGIYDWHTGKAIGLFQRRNFVVARGQLDEATRTALISDSRELDFRDALRVLRERVVDATGILADGSARNQPAPILGRLLDPAEMHIVPGHAPLPEGAPDMVSPATEAAARHLGWTDLDGVRQFLDRYADHLPGTAPGGFRVALRLPETPAYYTDHMDLRVELDRGDVWYDPAPRHRKVTRRPAMILWTRVNGKDIALVRWPTTIGGWEKERLPGGAVVNRFKESDVGPRVWRDLYAAPAWFPPPSTPDDDLVRRQWNGRYTIKRDTLGPGYRSAYGLAMFVHHQVVPTRAGVRFDDNGIRVHGSANYPSIVRGTSHGCHRLFNHHALRLASFVVEHREHRRHGEEVRNYTRVVNKGGHRVIRLRSRGYRYELVPPVPVEVTEGRILSRLKKPPLWAR
jgi:peptidoglycan hydrolase-like protein with peptidoglycan-binding domain